jgi:hypothetical protein
MSLDKKIAALVAATAISFFPACNDGGARRTRQYSHLQQTAEDLGYRDNFVENLRTTYRFVQLSKDGLDVESLKKQKEAKDGLMSFCEEVHQNPEFMGDVFGRSFYIQSLKEEDIEFVISTLERTDRNVLEHRFLRYATTRAGEDVTGNKRGMWFNFFLSTAVYAAPFISTATSASGAGATATGSGQSATTSVGITPTIY